MTLRGEEPVVLAAEPQLFVTDMARALDFYRQGLGFSVVFTHGEPPFYAQVARGGARLNLRHVDIMPIAPGFREHEPDLLATIVTLEAAGPLFAAYDAAGLAFHQRLRRESWGAWTFILADPDGNLIAFSAPM